MTTNKQKNSPKILLMILCLAVSAVGGFIFLNYSAESKIQPVDAALSAAKTSLSAPSLIPSPTPSAAPKIINSKIKPAPPRAVLPASVWVPQTFNNCGPASVSMLLQHFGYNAGQAELKEKLRTNSDDRNIFAYEIADLLKKEYNLNSKILYNGDIDRLKLLIANGFYVIIEFYMQPDDDIGHVSIVRGYDDSEGVLIVDDPYAGVNRRMTYDVFDEHQWKAFNREYMPVYRADQETILKNIVGSDWDERTMFERSAADNEIAILNDSQDSYSWFNLGVSYYNLGRYQNAKQAFETSKDIGWTSRALWYQYEPIKNYNAIGEYQNALNLIAVGLKDNNSYPELHYETAMAHWGLGNLAKAREALKLSLQLAPDFQPAKKMAEILKM